MTWSIKDQWLRRLSLTTRSDWKEKPNVRKLSEEIRERIVIAELASSLAHEDERSVDLLKSALLIARLDNEDFDLESYLRKTERMAEKIRWFSRKGHGEESSSRSFFSSLRKWGFMAARGLRSSFQQLFERGHRRPGRTPHHPFGSFYRVGQPTGPSGKRSWSARALHRDVPRTHAQNSDMKGKEILVDPFGGKIVSQGCGGFDRLPIDR